MNQRRVQLTTMTSSSCGSGAGDVDFVSLYYRGEAMSLDEDEFSEFAASCAAGCKRALSGSNDDLHHALLIDRHAVIQGVYIAFDALVRELNPLSRAPPRCAWASGGFAALLAAEPNLAFALLQTTIHTLVG
jgi:hypothetical protein